MQEPFININILSDRGLLPQVRFNSSWSDSTMGGYALPSNYPWSAGLNCFSCKIHKPQKYSTWIWKYFIVMENGQQD